MKEHGYDDVAALDDASEADLEKIGIKAGHAKRMKNSTAAANNTGLTVETELDPSTGMQFLSRTTGSALSAPESAIEAGRAVRGKSAGDPRAGVESDMQKAAEFQSRGRATSAAALKLAAKKELTLKYDPAASVNDMEYAKQKLQAQAAKIRELESKLAENTMDTIIDSSNAVIKEAQKAPASQRMSAEERLQAHKERKAAENKTREGDGAWAAPPPLESAAKTVPKENDDLLDRLTTKNAKEHREQVSRART